MYSIKEYIINVNNMPWKYYSYDVLFYLILNFFQKKSFSYIYGTKCSNSNLWKRIEETVLHELRKNYAAY